MKDKLETCYVCGQKYNPNNIKKIYFTENNGKRQGIDRIVYKGKYIPLCNRCLRTVGLVAIMRLHLDLEVKDDNGRTK